VWNDAEEQTLDKTTGRFVPKSVFEKGIPRVTLA